jgi:quinol-cytochrome oxidoreductase complex cytochrome b subunit
MSRKTRLNYWVDILIGLAFAATAVSGVVLLFAGSGGYQGGRNPRHAREVLFLSRWVWKALHDWSGIVMAVGVGLHFVLHWSWLTCMTRNLFRRLGRSGARRSVAIES